MTRLGYASIAFVIAAVGLLMPASVFAQDPRGGGGNQPGSSGSPGGAVHSGGAVSSPGGSFGSGASSGGGSDTGSSPTPSGWGSNGSDRRGNGGSNGRAVGRWQDINRHYGTEANSDGNRWYSRSRGDREVIGKAIGRDRLTPSPGGLPRWDDQYYGYGYTSRPYYNMGCLPMYGFGGYGYGYFFYNPIWWAGRGYRSSYFPCDIYDFGAFGLGYGYGGYAGYGLSGYGYPGYGYGFGSFGGSPYGAYGYGSAYSSSVSAAGLKLKVKPKNAQVFVDGYFAGSVDEFDGVFQRLPLNAGQHHIEVRAEGYTTLTFDVSAEPYQTINYRGELKRTR